MHVRSCSARPCFAIPSSPLLSSPLLSPRFLLSHGYRQFSLIGIWLVVYSIVVVAGEHFFLPKYEVEWCTYAQRGFPNIISYPNPLANNNPCYIERTVYLLGMNQLECAFARRMIFAVLFGALVGFERKAADRAAGIRTMALVCLGACFFTYCSQFAFRVSMQIWDSARVTAPIASGKLFTRNEIGRPVLMDVFD